MKTITFITDLFFTFFIFFILTLTISYYYLERVPAIILSMILGVAASGVYAKFLGKKRRTTQIKNSESLAFEQAMTQLCLYTESEQLALFEKALIAKEYKVEKSKGGIAIKGKNAVLFPLFGFDGVTKTDVVRIFNSIKTKETAYILSREVPLEIKTFIDRFNSRIITVNEKDTYHFLKQTSCLPCTKFEFSKKSPLTFSVFKNLFTKAKAKNLLAFGLIFIFSSYFVPIKAYYIICGSVFLFLALYARLFGKETTQTAWIANEYR